jgi:hypothetical protein
MIHLQAVLALICAPSLAALPPAADDLELAFGPEEETVLTESYRQDYELRLADIELTVTVDGDEQVRQEPDIELTIRSSETIEFTDEYLGVEDGTVTRMRRTYDALVSESSQELVDEEGETAESERTGESVLEEESVLFVWDDEEDEYQARYEGDEDGDIEDLLDELEAESVLARFLPDDEVEEGDAWEVDVAAFNHLSSPGGYVAIEDGEDRDSDFEEQFDDSLEGEIEAEWEETRTIDGVEHAVIVLHAELSTEIEQSEELELSGAEGTTTTVYEFDFELDGELLWNLEERHGVSLELAGDVTVSIEEAQDISAPNGELEILDVRTLEGEIEFEVEVE